MNNMISYLEPICFSLHLDNTSNLFGTPFCFFPCVGVYSIYQIWSVCLFLFFWLMIISGALQLNNYSRTPYAAEDLHARKSMTEDYKIYYVNLLDIHAVQNE